MALPQLVGHQLVLVALLLTRVQLLGQDEQGVLLALQLPFAHQELQTETSPARCHSRGRLTKCEAIKEPLISTRASMETKNLDTFHTERRQPCRNQQNLGAFWLIVDVFVLFGF